MNGISWQRKVCIMSEKLCFAAKVLKSAHVTRDHMTCHHDKIALKCGMFYYTYNLLCGMSYYAAVTEPELQKECKIQKAPNCNRLKNKVKVSVTERSLNCMRLENKVKVCVLHSITYYTI